MSGPYHIICLGFYVKIGNKNHKIERDVSHKHAPEILKQLGCKSESELQAHLDQCCYSDWFDGEIFDKTFPTMDEAHEAIAEAYTGEDKDGLGIDWSVAW